MDVKSKNILLDKEYNVAKIADVGLARVLGNTVSTRGLPLGTFHYAAPELLMGDRNLVTEKVQTSWFCCCCCLLFTSCCCCLLLLLLLLCFSTHSLLDCTMHCRRACLPSRRRISQCCCCLPAVCNKCTSRAYATEH